MPAHVFIPLLALGCLFLTGAFVAVVQSRSRGLRWMGAGVLASTIASAILFLTVSP